MQKYPYLERNTQKLKNHTRTTGFLCKGPRFKQSRFQPTLSFWTFYFLYFGTTYMQEDMHTSKSTQAQLGLFTAGLSLRSYEKTEAQHRPYSQWLIWSVLFCWAIVIFGNTIHIPPLGDPVEGMTLMPHLIFFKIFKSIKFEWSIGKKKVGNFAISLR